MNAAIATHVGILKRAVSMSVLMRHLRVHPEAKASDVEGANKVLAILHDLANESDKITNQFQGKEEELSVEYEAAVLKLNEYLDKVAEVAKEALAAY